MYKKMINKIFFLILIFLATVEAKKDFYYNFINEDLTVKFHKTK